MQTTAPIKMNSLSDTACTGRGSFTQPLITTFFPSNSGKTDATSNSRTNIIEPVVKSTTNLINGPERTFSLPIYYNNVRGITNKRNINMRIELSTYEVLCFTETWLDDEHSSSVYFPSKFTVYRCDRKTRSYRRSGGVAILVHHSLISKSTSFSAAE